MKDSLLATVFLLSTSFGPVEGEYFSNIFSHKKASDYTAVDEAGGNISSEIVAHTSTKACLNSRTFEKYFDGNMRSCQKIRLREERRRRACVIPDFNINCPQSCGRCCDDDFSYVLTTKLGTQKRCSWVGEKLVRQERYCKTWNSGRMVRDACPAACQFCFLEVQSASNRPSISLIPSVAPSVLASQRPSDLPSVLPSSQPSILPSLEPSTIPSVEPSDSPSASPSLMPSKLPSDKPSDYPSAPPSLIPSDVPSLEPSDYPSTSPSWMPSDFPSVEPSDSPSMLPSVEPSDSPSTSPSAEPSDSPSTFPSLMPSDLPSTSPSSIPSDLPSVEPSDSPSMLPSLVPSTKPSKVISTHPTMSNMPSDKPSLIPSDLPSSEPSDIPSNVPSGRPSDQPSSLPSSTPSDKPSSEPSDMPSNVPSDRPSDQPSSLPSSIPSDKPSNSPSALPSLTPSVLPSLTPSKTLSSNPSTRPTQSIKPSASPTTSPTTSPSTSTPTTSPTEACKDDSEFMFTLDNGNIQGCEWLTYQFNPNKSQIRIERYCPRKYVKKACSLTCDNCNCVDDPSYTFTLDNGNIVACTWFTENDLNSAFRIENYCPREVDGQFIYDQCRKSCSEYADCFPQQQLSVSTSFLHKSETIAVRKPTKSKQVSIFGDKSRHDH